MILFSLWQDFVNRFPIKKNLPNINKFIYQLWLVFNMVSMGNEKNFSKKFHNNNCLFKLKKFMESESQVYQRRNVRK